MRHLDVCHLWLQHKGDWKDERLIPVKSSFDENDGRTEKESRGFVQDTKDTQDFDGFKDTEDTRKDSTTVATYSLMLWYTPEFKNTFFTEADMEAFINLVIEETNQGYINSQIPVRTHAQSHSPLVTMI